MVAQTPQPDLSERELHLLAAFLTYRYDMVTLAEREGLNPRELLAFARSAAVQANLTALKTFADQAFALRSLESRTLAIDYLEQVAKNNPDPVEKRRAASAILRGLSIPVPRTSKPSITRYLHPPGREAWKSVADATDNGDRDSRDDSPNSSSPHPRVPVSPCHPSTPSPHTPTPTTPPTPRLTPSPSLTPFEIAKAAMSACIHRDEPDHLATLEAFLAPGATFNHEPIIDAAKQAPPFYPTGAISIRPQGPQSDTTARIRITAFGPPHNLITLTRSPEGPHPNCWLIADIHEDTS